MMDEAVTRGFTLVSIDSVLEQAHRGKQAVSDQLWAGVEAMLEPEGIFQLVMLPDFLNSEDWETLAKIIFSAGSLAADQRKDALTPNQVEFLQRWFGKFDQENDFGPEQFLGAIKQLRPAVKPEEEQLEPETPASLGEKLAIEPEGPEEAPPAPPAPEKPTPAPQAISSEAAQAHELTIVDDSPFVNQIAEGLKQHQQVQLSLNADQVEQVFTGLFSNILTLINGTVKVYYGYCRRTN